MPIIDRVIKVVEEIEDKQLIEKVDSIVNKCDRWAIPEGFTDMFNDMTEIKKQLKELNETSKELLKLKRKQLKIKGGK